MSCFQPKMQNHTDTVGKTCLERVPDLKPQSFTSKIPVSHRSADYSEHVNTFLVNLSAENQPSQSQRRVFHLGALPLHSIHLHPGSVVSKNLCLVRKMQKQWWTLVEKTGDRNPHSHISTVKNRWESWSENNFLPGYSVCILTTSIKTELHCAAPVPSLGWGPRHSLLHQSTLEAPPAHRMNPSCQAVFAWL